MAELLIILVNYRRPGDTIACIESLRRSTYMNYEIVLIDNASGDGSVDQIQSRFPELHVVQNRENVGFAAGNNTGLELLLSGTYALALLLNNDTVVEPGSLAALVKAMHSYPRAGILGPKILYYNRSGIIWFAGGVLNAASGAVSHRGILETDHGQHNEPGPCDFVTGCCLLVRRDVVEQIGMLDPNFFAYFEDADFCLRARRAGFDIRYEPSARIWHKVSSTSQWDSPVYLYFTLRNRLILLKKNSTLLKSLPYLPMLVYYYARQFVRLLLKWRNLPATRAAWFGLVDGLRGNTGILGRGRLDQIVESR